VNRLSKQHALAENSASDVSLNRALLSNVSAVRREGHAVATILDILQIPAARDRTNAKTQDITTEISRRPCGCK
jgi:hypothetical protein